MSYSDAFAAVPGCTVEWCEYFGSYQGRLLAKLIYKGETLYLHDWYGSCSGCDSFEAEFDYNEGVCDKHRWGDDAAQAGCPHCQEAKAKHHEHLAAFGLSYVESALPLKNIIKALEAEDCTWDDDLKAMLEKLYAERAAIAGADGATARTHY